MPGNIGNSGRGGARVRQTKEQTPSKAALKRQEEIAAKELSTHQQKLKAKKEAKKERAEKRANGGTQHKWKPDQAKYKPARDTDEPKQSEDEDADEEDSAESADIARDIASWDVGDNVDISGRL